MVIKFQDQDWFLAATRNMSFWHQCLSDEGHYRHLQDFGIQARLRVLHLTIEGTNTSAFMSQPNYSEYAEAVMKAVGSENDIQSLRQKYETLAERLRIAVRNLGEGLNEERLTNFFDEYRLFSAGLMITATIGRTGGDQLATQLKVHGLSEAEIDATIAAITYPQQSTPLFQSQLDLLKIGAAVQGQVLKDESINQALASWLETYGHIPINFCEDPWVLADAKSQLEQLLQTSCEEAYAEAIDGHAKRIALAQAQLDKINNPSITTLAHAVAEATYLNEYRKNLFSWASFAFRPAFAEIAAMAGSSNWRDCFYLMPEEMLACVQGQTLELNALKAKRAVIGAFVDEQGQLRLLDEAAIQLFHQHIQGSHQAATNETEPIKELKGFAASAGKVSGTAKVILSAKDFDKLLPGDILVTTMTSVDFVPVMARAAAFVTNEGGITCHASIVAREMGKPCIIGTKIATQVFKDGDLVEVDADHGIVRKIESV